MSAPAPLPANLIVLPPLGTPDPLARPGAARARRRKRALTWGLRLALCLCLASLGAGLTLAAGAMPPALGQAPTEVSACGLDIGPDDGVDEMMRLDGADMTVTGSLILG